MPEVRLIDANALLKVLSEQTFCCSENTAVRKGVFAALDYCRQIIDAAQTIEAEPIRHGRWILTQDEQYEYCYCSECGYDTGENWAIGSEIKYCSNCGARMDADHIADDSKRLEVLTMTVNEAIKVCNVLAFHGYGEYKLRTECGFVGMSCYPDCIDNDSKTINMEGSGLENYEDCGDLQMICDEIDEVLSGGADNG